MFLIFTLESTYSFRLRKYVSIVLQQVLSKTSRPFYAYTVPEAMFETSPAMFSIYVWSMYVV